MIRQESSPLFVIFSLFAGYMFTLSCVPQSSADQPIAFSHRQHVENKITCIFCHSGATKNSQATIPSVTLCMSCHSVVKTESEEVKRVRDYLDRHEEIPWNPIYALPKESLVFFDHHRHAAAGVQCATCHGDVATQDNLRREITHTMGSCVRCHLENQAKFGDPRLAADCATCHR